MEFAANLQSMREGFDPSLRPQQCKSVSSPAVLESPARPGIALGIGTACSLSQRNHFYFSLLRRRPGFLTPKYWRDIQQSRRVTAWPAPCPCWGTHQETPLQRHGTCPSAREKPRGRSEVHIFLWGKHLRPATETASGEPRQLCRMGHICTQVTAVQLLQYLQTL